MIAQEATSASRSFVEQAVRVREKLTESIVGQDGVLDQLLICALTGSHALIVGAPGLAKTLTVKGVSRSLNLKFNRIQFTPDLMSSDITGYELLARIANGNESIMKFRRGPIFANLILADEINRAAPKTQSAWLEAIAEYHATIGGETHNLEDPFLVVATQNPLSKEVFFALRRTVRAVPVMASQDDSVCILLLSLLSYVHHEVAVQSAVGLFVQASEPSLCLNVELVLALSDDNLLSVYRAMQWLFHPVWVVQEKAIRYLCKAPRDFGATEQTDYAPVIVCQHEEHFPGVWLSQRELPVEAVQSYLDTKAEMSSLVRTLLLATKMSLSIEEATKDLRGKSSSLLVCAALSMAERTDLEAVVYYEKFRESLAVGDDLASPLYVILRDVKGPEIRSLRTKLRLKQGSSVLFNYG